MTRMKNLKININGQGTLLMCFTLGVALIGTLLAFVGYQNQQLRVQSQVKEAYALLDVMDQAGKDIRAAWDLSGANLAPGDIPFCTPIGIPPAPPFNQVTCAQKIQAGMAAQMPNITGAACYGPCTAGANTPILCYNNTQNPGKPYCFYGNAGTITNAGINLELVIPDKKPTLFEKSVDYIATLFSKIKKPTSHLESILESKAVAAVVPLRTDPVGPAPVCPGPGCMTCGPGTGVACVTVYGCPKTFNGCAAYDGTAANALFVQQYYLVTPNSP